MFSLELQAEEKVNLFDLSLEELLTVKIASLQDETVYSAPSSVTLITRQQIKALGITRLQEILNYVPGFQSTRDTEQGTANRLSVRGRSTALSESILVLLDGQRLNDLYTGGTSVLNRMLDLGHVDRIEIIRGPGSALYGSNAFLGVINIITVSNENELKIKFDSLGEKYSSLLYNHSYNNHNSLDLFLSLFERSGDDYQLTDIYGVTGTTTDPIEGYDFYFKYDINNWLFTSRHMQRTLDDFIVFGALGNGINHEETRQTSFSAKYSKTVTTNFEYSARASHSSDKWETIAMIIPQAIEIAPGFSLNENFIGGPLLESQSNMISIDASYNINDSHLLSFGIAFEQAKISHVATAVTHDLTTLDYIGELIYLKDNLSFIDEKTRRINSLYLQDQFNISENIQVTAGFRYDSYNDFGNSINPRLAVIWQQDETSSLKFMYGTAFRAPNFLELYDRNNVVDFGNANLIAEEVTTTEVAWIKSNDRWKFEMTFFHNDFSELISLDAVVIDPENPFNSPSFINKDNQHSAGLEAQVQVQLTDNFSIKINLNRFTTSSQIDVSKNSGTLILDYQWADIHLNLSTFYRGNNEKILNQQGYSVTNFNIRYEMTQHFLLTIAADNLFDKQYQTISFVLPEGVANQGRALRLGLEYSF